jgi:hypothetical protein
VGKNKMQIKVTWKEALRMLREAAKNCYRNSEERALLEHKIDRIERAVLSAEPEVILDDDDMNMIVFKPTFGEERDCFENEMQRLRPIANNKFDVYEYTDYVGGKSKRIASDLNVEDFTWNENGYWEFKQDN